jgi:hypothetical protein
MFKLAATQDKAFVFYTKNIFKVWAFGFLADIIGAAILFIIVVLEPVKLPHKWTSAISFDPFSHTAAVVIIVLVMLLSGLFIFLFNYNITFKNQIEDKRQRFKLALFIAAVTIPWTFLLPTKWFYKG